MNHKWEIQNLSAAMVKAISSYADPRFLKQSNGRLSFNGFWRNGDKQNVCLWIDNATWHDAKTGDGGGCKEFAKTAFNLSLPDFMQRFGFNNYACERINVSKTFSDKQQVSSIAVNDIWINILHSTKKNPCLATKWLEDERKLINAKKLIGSGYALLTSEHIPYFSPSHHDFLRQRLNIGKQIMVPLRSTLSDDVKNIFFRTISHHDEHNKTRLLPDMGGWSDNDRSLRAFGFPYLIHDFSHIVLCEGMADYFAAECLLEDNEKYLPLGAANADALVKWAQWFAVNKYAGFVHIVYQLDRDMHGNLSQSSVGPKKALQCLGILKKHNIQANLFDWFTFIKNITTNPQNINDLADCLKTVSLQEKCESNHLNYHFLASLNHKENKCKAELNF